MDKEVRKKLAQMANGLVKKDQQNQKLKQLGKTSSLDITKIFDNIQSALNSSAGQSKDDSIIIKIDKVLDLIKINTKLANGHANFDTKEYVNEKNIVFNIKSKYQSTGLKPAAKCLKEVNKIYSKHKRVSKLLTNK